MQTRRAFIFKGLTNLATFAGGGSLIMFGKNRAEKIVKKYTQKDNSTNSSSKSSTITISNVTDFALGGTLGITIKKLTEKSIESNLANGALVATVNKLQNLENNDLPGIERTLQEFVTKENIRYKANANDDRIKSIQCLLDAILIHVSSQNKSIKPFLEELQKLRTVFAQPVIEELQNNGDIGTASKEAFSLAVKREQVVEYLTTVFVNALKDIGVGEKIGKNAVDSISKKELIGADGVTALQEAVTAVFRNEQFIKDFTYATGSAVIDEGIANRLVNVLADKLEIRLQDKETTLAALKIALQSISVSEASEKV